MNLAPFRSVLALPGVRPLMLLMLFARIPPTAAGVTVTLHVVTTLDKGYAAAGTVGFATMVGLGLGSPLMGKLVDTKGLRFVLALSLLEGAFWVTAPLMDYYLLLVLAFANGLVAVPVMSIGRQALTAIVPEPQRRPAFSLDSISVELSFMVGPAAGVLIATKYSTGTALIVIGVAILTASAVLFVVNPVLLHEDDVTEGPPPPLRQWLRGPMIAALIVPFGATMVLSGMEISAIASLERSGQQSWLGLVFVVMCAASALGGLFYGSLKRVPTGVFLLACMALLEIPVGLGDGNVWLLALALIPMNLACAPTITASSELIAKNAPPTARGLALGLQGSAFTFGVAAGQPLAGIAVDHSGPPLGFVVAGLAGLLVAGVGWVLSRQRQAVSSTS
ncbi:Predicted arabinose efflux permease, MFS family [Lentzea albidocapillata subsp. violacea]|uniref:Predicted arabinose efflux permease, MFS family n=1 Tax=Lentzea albidocapillata subsp. violacea TaxID=128104 RepID=A0A1G9HE88_9PSEU|nr:MFS transporter [Lentzea albidocapillata]SDL11014.1 Predicted arabinose efflux permease, MFS family [Lentzea albidocapillata subsp. violacea]